MTTQTQLMKYASQIAEDIQSRNAHFEREILDLETKLSTARASRDAARGAMERAANFQVQIRGNYQCPRCWIESEANSDLRPVPSETHDDLFRCRVCQSDFVVEF